MTDDDGMKGFDGMPPEWQAMLKEARQRARKVEAKWDAPPLVTPWDMYPDLERISMGWRMGAGETYMDYFCARYAALPDSDRRDWALAHPEPAPDWGGFLEMVEERLEFWAEKRRCPRFRGA